MPNKADRTDIFDQELKVGDLVTIGYRSKRWKPSQVSMIVAKIIKFTDKGVRLKYREPIHNHLEEKVYFGEMAKTGKLQSDMLLLMEVL